MHNFSDLVQREQLRGNYVIHSSSIYLNCYQLTIVNYRLPQLVWAHLYFIYGY